MVWTIVHAIAPCAAVNALLVPAFELRRGASWKVEKKSREEREREEKGDRKIPDRMEKRWMEVNDEGGEEYFKLLDSGFDPSRVHLGSHSAREIGMAKVATKFPNLILDS